MRGDDGEFYYDRTIAIFLRLGKSYSLTGYVLSRGCLVTDTAILVQSTLVISKSKGPSKHFEISVLRHIRCVVLREKQFEQPNFTNEHVI